MVLHISGRDGDQTVEKKRKINDSRLLYSKIILSWKQWKSSNFGKDFLGLFWRTRNTPLKVWLQALVEGIAGICLKWVVLLVSWMPRLWHMTGVSKSPVLSQLLVQDQVCSQGSRNSRFSVLCGSALPNHETKWHFPFHWELQTPLLLGVGRSFFLPFLLSFSLFCSPPFFPTFFPFFCNTISYTLLCYSYA